MHRWEGSSRIRRACSHWSWTWVAQDVEDGDDEEGWSRGGDLKSRLALGRERQYCL